MKLTIQGNRKWLLGVRHLQALILFLSLAINIMMRVNLSVGMVLMTDHNSTSEYPIFDWSHVEQATAQSAFFFGYLPMNLIAAVLVTKFDNKMLLLVSTTFSSVTILVTPTLVIYGGYYVLLIGRTILGIMQGFMMAVVMGQLARWIPPDERSRCGAFVLGGLYFGTAASLATAGWIGSMFGWPSIFYFSGSLGIVWCIMWAILAADDPSQCWYISAEEKAYINKELLLGAMVSKKSKIPWKKIIANKPCWALLLIFLGYMWGMWTLVIEIPTYFKAVLNLEATDNGLVSALPYACVWLFSFAVSYLADFLIKKKITSIGASRKLFTTIAHTGAGICLLVLSGSRDSTLVIVMYSLGVTLLGFVFIGFMINHLDIIPKYAGFFMGITNGFSNFAAFFGPIFAGHIVTDITNEQQWRIVFWASSAIFFLSNLIFIIWGKGEVQDLGEEEDPDAFLNHT